MYTIFLYVNTDGLVISTSDHHFHLKALMLPLCHAGDRKEGNSLGRCDGPSVPSLHLRWARPLLADADEMKYGE